MNLDDERRLLRNELESMRSAGARRQELSLHACKRLFFDLGIRPSTATVRELTQTGSASDIPKDIEHFWARLRSNSRIRIAGGAIPPALEERAGELLGELFEAARIEARAEFEEERHEMQARLETAGQQSREAELRRELLDEARQRSERRADAALARVHELEATLAGAQTEGSANRQGWLASLQRLEADNEALRQRLDAAQDANAALRERIDGLQAELRERTEHYAQQIKDAVTEAERRVKPMLVELDSLRSVAATYQAGIREANRKEFDFIQQLASAKARGDQLEVRLRDQSDEIDVLTREIAALHGRQDADPAVAAMLCELARAGRLSSAELGRLGTAVDAQVSVPPQCPRCGQEEPELTQVGHQFELSCPECGHASGPGASRLAVLAGFYAEPSANSASAQA